MKLINTNRFLLPTLTGTPPVLHLATIQDGVKEYICFYTLGSIYVEEITGGHLELVEEDSLHEELCNLLLLKGILDARKPLLPDEWKKYKPVDKVSTLSPGLQSLYN